jgi:predicted metal-dependent HD superfamily phosphohydrolase
MPLISETTRAELIGAYAAPDRHYHNLAHIEALLSLAKQHQDALADPDAVEAAIWFHDAVYDTHRHDNEEKSADLAVDRLQNTLAQERLDRIAAMIRATASHQLPDFLSPEAVRDCALFLDMDLAILGSAEGEYESYAAAIRSEYSWVPEPLWIEGRRKVLEKFLSRATLYMSPQFRASHEEPARHNLTLELATLPRSQ